MKTSSILFSLLLFIITSSFAQSQDLLTTQALVTSNNGAIYTFDRSDKTIQGSPYIQETFLRAKVAADKEQIFNARYNAVTDEVEVETEKSTVQAINKLIPGITVTFLKDNKTYKGMTYFNEDGNSVTGFLVPISNSNSNVKLFLKEKKTFIDRKPAKSSYQEATPAKFVNGDDVYYIAITNEIAKPLSNNKKEIAALFPQHEKDILKYISSERLNVRKQDDLIKLVNHLNQLTQ